MGTIGYKHRGPLRDHTSFCDYCGVAWLRSELTGPDDDGYYRCPDDAEGRSTKTLDYLRALNAAQPSEVNGVRERPGEAPAHDTLIGWAWVQGRDGLGLASSRTTYLAGTLRLRGYVLPAFYDFDGISASEVACWPFDRIDPELSTSGRYYQARITDDGDTLRVVGLTRVGGPEQVHAQTERTGDFLVFAYGPQGGRGVLTEVASAWISAAGDVLTQDGSAVTVTKGTAGIYTLDLADNYQVATCNQFVATDTDSALVSARLVWAGKTGPAQAKVRAVNSGGSNADADFLIRFYV